MQRSATDGEAVKADGARRAAWLLAALGLGTLLVAVYDRALAPSRYAYSGDSASYLEMADSLRTLGRPLVTPWDVVPGDRDAVPQPLFPPAFPLLIAALTPLTGDARSASLLPGRVAAALLPLLLVALWQRTVPDPALLGLGVWVLLAPGVRQWQYIAYSDVPELALALIALGALVRGLAPGGGSRWLVLAGLTAGLSYCVRNSGLAVLAASGVTLAYLAFRGELKPRAALAWAGGAAGPLAGLAAYNLATFGRLLPYDMPPSARGWWQNTGDYAGAQLVDLGLPPPPLAPLPPVAAILVLGALLAVLAGAWWRARREPGVHRLLTLLGAYVAAGATLLVASRSRYEWGGLIETRNTLQYSWAFGLAALIAVRRLLPPRGQQAATVAALLVLAALAVEAVRDARAASTAPPDAWLALSADPAVIGAVRRIPADTLIASNTAVLFRIAASRPVRQLDVSGGDRDLGGSLVLLRAAAGPRPAAFLLVCNEWTQGFSACGAGGDGDAPACERLSAGPPIAALCRTEVRGPAAPGRG